MQASSVDSLTPFAISDLWFSCVSVLSCFHLYRLEVGTIIRFELSFCKLSLLSLIFKRHQQCEQFCLITSLQVIVVRLAGGICHSSDKYLTPACNTHMEGASCLSDTAASVPSRPAGCPLAPLSCEKLFRADRSSRNQKLWHLAGT